MGHYPQYTQNAAGIQPSRQNAAGVHPAQKKMPILLRGIQASDKRSKMVAETIPGFCLIPGKFRPVVAFHGRAYLAV